MNYLYIIISFLSGSLASFLFYKNKIKDLSDLRLRYLMSQESDTKFLKDKVLGLELSFHNFKSNILNRIDEKNTNNL